MFGIIFGIKRREKKKGRELLLKERATWTHPKVNIFPHLWNFPHNPKIDRC
jgi:hypothetical protein